MEPHAGGMSMLMYCKEPELYNMSSLYCQMYFGILSRPNSPVSVHLEWIDKKCMIFPLCQNISGNEKPSSVKSSHTHIETKTVIHYRSFCGEGAMVH